MLISLVSAYDTDRLMDALVDARARGAATLRVHQNSDGTVQFKVNSGMWTAPVGEIDPASDLFARRRDEEGRYRTLTDPASV